MLLLGLSSCNYFNDGFVKLWPLLGIRDMEVTMTVIPQTWDSAIFTKLLIRLLAKTSPKLVALDLFKF